MATHHLPKTHYTTCLLALFVVVSTLIVAGDTQAPQPTYHQQNGLEFATGVVYDMPEDITERSNLALVMADSLRNCVFWHDSVQSGQTHGARWNLKFLCSGEAAYARLRFVDQAGNDTVLVIHQDYISPYVHTQGPFVRCAGAPFFLFTNSDYSQVEWSTGAHGAMDTVVAGQNGMSIWAILTTPLGNIRYTDTLFLRNRAALRFSIRVKDTVATVAFDSAILNRRWFLDGSLIYSGPDTSVSLNLHFSAQKTSYTLEVMATDTNLCSGRSTIVISEASSVEQEFDHTIGNSITQFGTGIRLWPQPSSQNVQLENKGSAITAYRIYDTFGRVLIDKSCEIECNSTCSIDLRALSEGSYLLELHRMDERSVQSLVVIRE